MPVLTLEKRVDKIENRLQELEARQDNERSTLEKKGWFVGIDADNQHFESATRFGQLWRSADKLSDQ